MDTTQNVSSVPRASTKIKQDNRKRARIVWLVPSSTMTASVALIALLECTLKNPRRLAQSACLEKYSRHKSQYHVHPAVQGNTLKMTAQAALRVLLERFKMQRSTCHLARYARVVTFAMKQHQL